MKYWKLGGERRKGYGVGVGGAENAELVGGFEVVGQRFLVELELVAEFAALEWKEEEKEKRGEDPRGSRENGR